jgi:hypothetical protein
MIVPRGWTPLFLSMMLAHRFRRQKASLLLLPLRTE